MFKKCLVSVIVLACALNMCACKGEQLTLNEEDENKVVNYASDILVEHDVNHESTLRSFSEKELNRIVKLDMLAAAAQAGIGESSTEAEEESSEEAVSDDTSGGEGGSADDFSNMSIAEALGLTDFDISFKGYDILQQYPETEEQAIGTFTISPGSSEDKLLVLHFDIFNAGNSAAKCDILDMKPQFRLVLNDRKHSFLNTLLLNDLTIFDDEIEAGQSKDAVLIAEISSDKAESIDKIGLIVKMNGENIKISLE